MYVSVRPHAFTHNNACTICSNCYVMCLCVCLYGVWVICTMIACSHNRRPMAVIVEEINSQQQTHSLACTLRQRIAEVLQVDIDLYQRQTHMYTLHNGFILGQFVRGGCVGVWRSYSANGRPLSPASCQQSLELLCGANGLQFPLHSCSGLGDCCQLLMQYLF